MLALVPFLALTLTFTAQLLPDVTDRTGKSMGIGNLTVDELRATLRDLFPREAYGVVEQQIARLQTGVAHRPDLVEFGYHDLAGVEPVRGDHRRDEPDLRRRRDPAPLEAPPGGDRDDPLPGDHPGGLAPGDRRLAAVRPVDGDERAGRPAGHGSPVAGRDDRRADSFALTFYVGPDADQHWEWITPGSLVGTILFLIVSLLFRVYVQNLANYDKTYGSLGGVMVLLFWFWISSVVMLSAAQMNKVIEEASPLGKNYGQKIDPTITPDFQAMEPEPAPR